MELALRSRPGRARRSPRRPSARSGRRRGELDATEPADVALAFELSSLTGAAAIVRAVVAARSAASVEMGGSTLWSLTSKDGRPASAVSRSEARTASPSIAVPSRPGTTTGSFPSMDARAETARLVSAASSSASARDPTRGRAAPAVRPGARRAGPRARRGERREIRGRSRRRPARSPRPSIWKMLEGVTRQDCLRPRFSTGSSSRAPTSASMRARASGAEAADVDSGHRDAGQNRVPERRTPARKRNSGHRDHQRRHEEHRARSPETLNGARKACGDLGHAASETSGKRGVSSREMQQENPLRALPSINELLQDERLVALEAEQATSWPSKPRAGRSRRPARESPRASSQRTSSPTPLDILQGTARRRGCGAFSARPESSSTRTSAERLLRPAPSSASGGRRRVLESRVRPRGRHARLAPGPHRTSASRPHRRRGGAGRQQQPPPSSSPLPRSRRGATSWSRAVSSSRSATASGFPRCSRAPAPASSRSARRTARGSRTTSARSATAPADPASRAPVEFPRRRLRRRARARRRSSGLAENRGVVLVDDLGSGVLPGHRRRAHRARRAWRPALTSSRFSGDKLFGGPRAGIVLGRADAGRAASPPPAAAGLRADKLTLAALEGTLAPLPLGPGGPAGPAHADRACRGRPRLSRAPRRARRAGRSRRRSRAPAAARSPTDFESFACALEDDAGRTAAPGRPTGDRDRARRRAAHSTAARSPTTRSTEAAQAVNACRSRSGTAGHIDHGKTWLVRALTGKDTDRLPEEQARGISIDLGYAPLELPDGRRLSLIDVPGHERFVRNMVAGRERHRPLPPRHRRGRGRAAADPRAPGDHPAARDRARRRRDHEGGRGRAGARGARRRGGSRARARRRVVVVTSAKTGAGLDELAARSRTRRTRRRERAEGRDAALSSTASSPCAGIGTVATGTLWSGSIGEGDVLRAEPAGLDVRVRSVQVHDRPVERAEAGQRVAVALPGVERTSASPRRRARRSRVPIHCPTAWTSTLDELEPIPDGCACTSTTGPAEHHARVVRVGERWAQLRLASPAVAARGDRVVLRDRTTRRAAVSCSTRRPPATPAPARFELLRARRPRAPSSTKPVRAAAPDAHLGGEANAPRARRRVGLLRTNGSQELRAALRRGSRPPIRSTPGSRFAAEPWADDVLPLAGVEARERALYLPGAVASLGEALRAMPRRWRRSSPQRLHADPVRRPRAGVASSEREGRLVRLGDGLARSARRPTSRRSACMVEECEQAGSITLRASATCSGQDGSRPSSSSSASTRTAYTRRVGDERVLRRGPRPPELR